MSKYRIRKMEIADIESVMLVDERSFPKPWTKEIYTQEVTNNSYAYYFVMEVDDKIVGFCGLWLVMDEAQITNIAIDPDYRGNKYGEALFQYVMNFAIANHARILSLEVRVSNLTAQSLYKKFGLQPGGIRKNYYTDNHEDALVLWVNL